MKLIGVDFGSKRVGIAIAETEGGMAFPKCVIKRGADFFEQFKKICLSEGIQIVVLGESKDFKMQDNMIMKEIQEFKEKVEKEMKLEVKLHPEFMTSLQAVHTQGENEMLDASAATIILQAYLDKKKNMETDNKVEEIKEESQKISYDDFKKVEIRSGEIVSVEKVEGSEKLLKLKVDFNEAEGPRQIVSGIAKYFEDEQTLVGKKCMFVTNLEPRNLMGLESNGMLFAVGGKDDNPFNLLEVSKETQNGTLAS